MKFNKHEDDVQKFLAGKVESLTLGTVGPRGKKGKKRRSQPVVGTLESGYENGRREHEEATLKFFAECALTTEFIASHGLPSPPTPEQIPAEQSVPSYPAHELGDSESKDTRASGEEVASKVFSSEGGPSAPYFSPRKRNWHKRDIPNWSHDDRMVYDAIRIHLGKKLEGKTAERASLLYRAVLARWRSVYKEADLLVSGLGEENVKKMLQRLKRDGERFQRWQNNPSTSQRIANAMEIYFLYPDRVHIFEDGSYAFVDEDGDLSGDINVIYRPIEDDNDAEDDRIMRILKGKGILPPKWYDLGAMMTYMESVRREKQVELDQWEQEHKEAIDRLEAQLEECKKKALLYLEEKLSKAPAPLDLNAIFGVKPSNLSRQPSPPKVRTTE